MDRRSELARFAGTRSPNRALGRLHVAGRDSAQAALELDLLNLLTGQDAGNAILRHAGPICDTKPFFNPTSLKFTHSGVNTLWCHSPI